MAKRKTIKLLCIVSLAILIAAAMICFSCLNWGFAREVSDCEAQLRLKVVHTAESWLGANESDGSHKAIVDLYNAHEPLAQNYMVKYTDEWCAAFVSAVAIQCELTDILPTECGCQRQIGLFQDLGCWEEDDRYIPLPGDIIYYAWGDELSGDCTGWADHVGIVMGTAGSFIKVIEGNLVGSVAVHYVSMNDATIRGYGLPDYASMCNE